MPNHVPLSRLIALHVQARRFGFVVLEGADRLLDWGAKSYSMGSMDAKTTASKKVADLLNASQPNVILARTARTSAKSHKRIRHFVSIVREAAEARSLPFHELPQGAVRLFFLKRGCSKKHSVAAMLASRFPDLAWKLPPKRKAWQSEARRMIVFDAAAIGVAFLAEGVSSLKRVEP